MYDIWLRMYKYAYIYVCVRVCVFVHFDIKIWEFVIANL